VGYCYEQDKFGTAKLTPQASDLIKPPRVAECPVQLEAVVEQVHDFGQPSTLKAIEVKIIRVHVDEHLLMDGEKNYIDPEKWSPLIMNFCEFFGLSHKLHPSRLAPVFAPSPRDVSKAQ